MQVNSINNYRFSHSNTVEKPVPEAPAPNFGRLIFKDRALERAQQNMKTLIDIKVESENYYLAEKAIRNWFRMFTEPWNLAVERHSHLPKFVEYLENSWVAKIYRNEIPKYNTRLAELGDEAADLTVEVTDRVELNNKKVAYTVNIPAYNIENRIFTLTPKGKSANAMSGVPTLEEVKLLKKGIYEEVVGEGFATHNSDYDIAGKFEKLMDTMKS